MKIENWASQSSLNPVGTEPICVDIILPESCNMHQVHTVQLTVIPSARNREWRPSHLEPLMLLSTIIQSQPDTARSLSPLLPKCCFQWRCANVGDAYDSAVRLGLREESTEAGEGSPRGERTERQRGSVGILIFLSDGLRVTMWHPLNWRKWPRPWWAR